MDKDTLVYLCFLVVGFAVVIGGLTVLGHVLGVLQWWFTGEYPFTHPWMEEER